MGPSQLYRIDAEAGVVYLLPGLEADFEHWRALIEAVLADPAFRRGMSFLSDRRDLPQLTKTYVEEVTRFTRANAARLGPCRWAIVASSPATYGMSRVAQANLLDSEVTVMAFYNFAEADAWVRGEGTVT